MQETRDLGLICELERSPGGGHGNPLQYSCLENLMNRGSFWATVHGVAKSWTQLKWLSIHSQESKYWGHCCCLVAKSCGTLATSWTVACQVPLSLGFPRQEYPEWAAISFSRGSFWPRDWTHIYIGKRILYHWASREARITWHHANISGCEICPSFIKIPQILQNTLRFVITFTICGFLPHKPCRKKHPIRRPDQYSAQMPSWLHTQSCSVFLPHIYKSMTINKPVFILSAFSFKKI